MRVTVFESTRRHIREHLNLPRHRHANLKSRKIGVGVVDALRTSI